MYIYMLKQFLGSMLTLSVSESHHPLTVGWHYHAAKVAPKTLQRPKCRRKLRSIWIHLQLMLMSPKGQGPLAKVETQPLRAPKKPLRECLTQWSPFQAKNLEGIQMMTVRTTIVEPDEEVVPRTQDSHQLKKTLRRQYVRVGLLNFLPIHTLHISVLDRWRKKNRKRKTSRRLSEGFSLRTYLFFDMWSVTFHKIFFGQGSRRWPTKLAIPARLCTLLMPMRHDTWAVKLLSLSLHPDGWPLTETIDIYCPPPWVSLETPSLPIYSLVFLVDLAPVAYIRLCVQSAWASSRISVDWLRSWPLRYRSNSHTWKRNETVPEAGKQICCWVHTPSSFGTLRCEATDHRGQPCRSSPKIINSHVAGFSPWSTLRFSSFISEVGILKHWLVGNIKKPNRFWRVLMHCMLIIFDLGWLPKKDTQKSWKLWYICGEKVKFGDLWGSDLAKHPKRQFVRIAHAHTQIFMYVYIYILIYMTYIRIT